MSGPNNVYIGNASIPSQIDVLRPSHSGIDDLFILSMSVSVGTGGIGVTASCLITEFNRSHRHRPAKFLRNSTPSDDENGKQAAIRKIDRLKGETLTRGWRRARERYGDEGIRFWLYGTFLV